MKNINPNLAMGLIRICSVSTLAVLLAVGEAHGGFLYGLAVDSYQPANRIYGFRVNEMTGELSPLPGFPIATQGCGAGGDLPESFKALAGPYSARLYAINNDWAGQSFDSPSVSVYDVDQLTGELHETVFSPIPLPFGYWSCLAIHPSGSPLVVGDIGETPTYYSDGSVEGSYDRNRVASFLIAGTNAVAAVGSPYTTMINTNAAAAPYSCAFSADGRYVYTGGAIGPWFAGFCVDGSNGTLTALPGSPYDSGFLLPCGFASDREGRLFAVQSADPIARVFDIRNGEPVPVASDPFFRGLGWAGIALLHPAGYYISAAPSLTDLSVLRITGSGAETQLEKVYGWDWSTCYPACSNPSLALNAEGTQLFVGYDRNNYIDNWNFNPSTGNVDFNSRFGQEFLPWNGTIVSIVYVPGAGRADLTVCRSDSPQPVIVNDQLTTTFTITNLGPDAVSEVIVSNAVPPRTQFCSVTPSQGACNITNGIIMCNLGSLQAHSCATISLLTLPLAATNVENAVKVIGDNTDPNYTNNVQTTLVTVRGQTAADLECTVSGTRNCADVQYTKCGMRAVITVKNRGSASAQRCRVRVYLSHDTVLDNGDLLIKEFYCGSLRPGRTRTKTFHMKMPVEYCGTVIFDRYLICIVDVDDVVKETDESNNVGVGEPIS